FPPHSTLDMRPLASTAAAVAAAILAALPLALPLAAQQQPRVNQANWELAEKFSPQNLRSKIYSTTLTPHWLGQSDSLCYDWKDHTGTHFLLVVPTTKTKKALFDQSKLAAQLSELSHKAHDPQNLPFTSVTFSKDRKTFTFDADSSKWQWSVASEMLTRLGPADNLAARGRGGRGGRGEADAPPPPPPDTLNTCGGAA